LVNNHYHVWYGVELGKTLNQRNSKLDQLRIERDPEKEPSSWGKLPLVLVAILLLAALAWQFIKPEPLPQVRTALATEIRGQAAGTVLNASGYVTARRQATVSSKFTGRVTEVLIEEGMEVEEGQVLARLDDTNLRASYELAAAQVAAAKTSVDETAALVTEANANLKRTRNLVERKLVSEAELDRALALADSLAAQLARKRADAVVAERGLDVWAQQLEDTIIRAPFAGVIVAKNAQPGEMISPVSAGGGFTRTGIGTIVDMASLEIEIDVNEAYINRVTAGQKVVATLDAYPDWRIPSHVIAIIPTADRQRATVEVRVGFDEQDKRILPDMGVKVAFQESAGEQPVERGVAVAAVAVREAAGQSYVLLVNEGVIERRAVTTGDRRGENVLIVAGLSGGETVVSSGPAELADGDAVQVVQ
jgi:RND family efflux transporter MFP subunit